MNFSRYTKIFTLVFAVWITAISAQDTVPQVQDAAFKIRNLHTNYIELDSLIRPLENEKFNEFNANRIHYYNNGNIAAKGHFKAWHLNSSASLLKGFGDFGYQNIFRNKYNVPLLDVKAPVAELHFLNAYRQGSHFGGYFSQNINPDMNYYLGYARTHSQGAYLRQETRYDNFDWSFQFKSKDHRYKGVAIFIWQRTKNEENGGLANTDDFKFTEDNRRERLSVNLQDSEGISQKAEVLLRHQYMIAPLDSTNETGIAIYHELSYNDKYHTFSSTDTVWDNYFLSDVTFDSTRFKNFYNEAGLKWDINSKYIQSINAGLFYNVHNYNSAYFSRSGSEAGINAKLNGLSGDKLFWNVDGSYLLGDKSAAALSASVNYSLKKSVLGGFALYNSIQPNYFEETYVSNHYNWLNSFDKNKNKTEFGVNYAYAEWFKLKGGYTLLSSWIIMNEQSRPVQLQQDVTMFNVDGYFRLFPRRAVKLDAHVAYNQMLTGAQFLRLAPVSVDSKLFYDFASFKTALRGQLGLNLKYFTAYNANDYNPATGTYFLQNHTEVGDFIYLNAYAIFKIRTVRVFVALENVLEGLLPYDYYSIPGYPMNDRTFRIGFKWRFFN